MPDAFRADSIPDMLSTKEFLELVKARLAPGGVVCANLWQSQRDYYDMLKTYGAVFAEWHVMHCGDSSNRIVVAMPQARGVTAEQWVEAARA